MFILVVPMKDVRVGDRVVFEVNDRKGWNVEKIVTLDGKITLLFGGPFSRTDLPETLVGVIRRPWKKGKTEEEMRESVMHCVRSVDRIPYGRSGVTPVSEEIDRQVEVLGKIIADYELGKPEGK